MVELEVHVIGANIGESIVVKLPGGVWGVVDSYSTKVEANSHATVNFLRHQGVTSLEFVCLTHPHSDHFRGMSILLREFQVKRFWSFGGYSPTELYKRIAKILLAKAATLHDGEEEEKDAEEFLSIFDFVRQTKGLQSTYLQLGQPLYRQEEGDILNITSLGPDGNAIREYEAKLLSCFDTSADPAILVEEPPAIHHNLISGAILIEFGAARVVLGGDMEAEAWEAVLRFDAAEISLKASLVKVSHHGSANGYCFNLWDTYFSPEIQATAVVTAYSKSGLPSSEGLVHISQYAKEVCTTSMAEVSRPFDDAWADNLGEISLEVRLALETVFRRVRPITRRNEGVCSFYISPDGSLRRTFSGDAGVIFRRPPEE